MTKPLKVPKEQRSFAAAGNLSMDNWPCRTTGATC
jgi:hypothetical protein